MIQMIDAKNVLHVLWDFLLFRDVFADQSDLGSERYEYETGVEEEVCFGY